MKADIQDPYSITNNMRNFNTYGGESAVEQKMENGHLSILLVDDRVIQAYRFRNRILSSRDLRGLLPEVDVASSVDEVVRKLKERSYDVGISDLHCPARKDGIDVMSHLIANNTRGIAVISASEINKDELSKIRNDLVLSNNSNFKLASFGRPVSGTKFHRLEKWLTALNNSTPPSSNNSSLLKAMFELPHLPFTLLFALIFTFSVTTCVLWIWKDTAVVPPIYSLTGMISGAGLLIEVMVGIKEEQRKSI